MANYSIKLDLLKLKGACVTNVKGRTTTKRCLVVPIDDSDLFLGEKGCYLDLTAIEIREPKFSETHCVKQSLPKEKFDAMTDEEKKAQPILGGLKQLEPKQPAQMEVKTTVEVFDDGSDLPF